MSTHINGTAGTPDADAKACATAATHRGADRAHAPSPPWPGCWWTCNRVEVDYIRETAGQDADGVAGNLSTHSKPIQAQARIKNAEPTGNGTEEHARGDAAHDGDE